MCTAAHCWRKSAGWFTLFSAESFSVHLTSARAYQVINVMNGGLMTLTSTLFKGSRIKDGIWTCNNAGGARVAGMASLSINVIVLLIGRRESCSCIMRAP